AGLRAAARSRRDRRQALEAAEALGALASARGLGEGTRDALAEVALGFFTPSLLRAACGATLARAGDPRGEETLRRVLRGWRAGGRDYAAHAAGELGLRGLIPDLERVRERRKASAEVVDTALRALRAEAP
ncbi:MAG: hypothetical protein AAGH15_19010, partial [Myxococcota bacterium]